MKLLRALQMTAMFLRDSCFNPVKYWIWNWTHKDEK